jgi:hypothetical protein
MLSIGVVIAIGRHYNERRCGLREFVMAVGTDRPARAPNLEEQFTALVREWKAGRGVSSSSREMARHPAYEAIIDMGEPVVALLLRELQREPDHWFIALRSITGADPVAPEHHGDLRAMAADWVAWGRANGYRW